MDEPTQFLLRLDREFPEIVGITHAFEARLAIDRWWRGVDPRPPLKWVGVRELEKYKPLGEKMNEPKAYRRRPQPPVAALQWTGSNAEDLVRFAGNQFAGFSNSLPMINTPNGPLPMEVGDWAVRRADAADDIYPIKKEIFNEMYEEVQDQSSDLAPSPRTTDARTDTPPLENQTASTPQSEG